MAAVETMYKVISKKYVGKHRVYKKDQTLPESEIMGGDEGKELALKGQKDAKRGDRKLPNVAATLVVFKGEKAKK